MANPVTTGIPEIQLDLIPTNRNIVTMNILEALLIRFEMIYRQVRLDLGVPNMFSNFYSAV